LTFVYGRKITKRKELGYITPVFFSELCMWEWDLSTGKWDLENMWVGKWD